MNPNHSSQENWSSYQPLKIGPPVPPDKHAVPVFPEQDSEKLPEPPPADWEDKSVKRACVEQYLPEGSGDV